MLVTLRCNLPYAGWLHLFSLPTPVPGTSLPSSTTMPPHCLPSLALVYSRGVLPLLLLASLILSASAQSSTSTISANVTVIKETSSFTTTSIASSGTQVLSVVTVLPTVLNVTLTIAPAPTSSANASSIASATVLATKIDPAFGVLGAVLILTGLPSAFLGHKNRWSVHPFCIYSQLIALVVGHLFS